MMQIVGLQPLEWRQKEEGGMEEDKRVDKQLQLLLQTTLLLQTLLYHIAPLRLQMSLV